ncbi:hypothetical protein ACWGA9_39835 [Streptomyces sp. NPDC054950]|uniref:hypothetical protein n=1 Tax=Streptomyces sp. NBC_00723 TaxID=2903673 RepID=UPI00386C2DBE
MKFATVERRGGPAAVAALSDAETAVVPAGFTDVESIVRVSEAERLSAVREALWPGERLPVSGPGLAAPVLRPGKILCVALNNSANPDRILAGPDTSAMFVKPPSSLLGHGRNRGT